MFKMTHKRQINEQRHEPKWSSNSYHGGFFSAYNADQARIYKRSILPLGVKPLQDKPFLRTNRTGTNFMVATGSII